jgi:transcriptional regulator with XRE-family HTH domain
MFMCSTKQLHTNRLREMGRFLRQCREHLISAESGQLSASSRRRVLGLRRIDIAERIGCSEDLYARLEQGRYQPNNRLLQKVAQALELSDAESRYLFTLAGIIPPSDTTSEVEHLPPHVQRVLQSFEPNVAYAIGMRWDILDANQTARMVLPMLNNTVTTSTDSLTYNLVYLMFTSPYASQIIEDWEQHAQRIVRDFRLDYSQAPDDPHFAALIERLREESPQFCAWWDDHTVGLTGVVRKDVHHPVAGVLSFEQTVYRLIDHPGIKTIFYVPLNTETQHKIDALRTAP